MRESQSGLFWLRTQSASRLSLSFCSGSLANHLAKNEVMSLEMDSPSVSTIPLLRMDSIVKAEEPPMMALSTLPMRPASASSWTLLILSPWMRLNSFLFSCERSFFRRSSSRAAEEVDEYLFFQSCQSKGSVSISLSFNQAHSSSLREILDSSYLS